MVRERNEKPSLGEAFLRRGVIRAENTNTVHGLLRSAGATETIGNSPVQKTRTETHFASKNCDYRSNRPKNNRPPIFSVERVRQYVDKQLTWFEEKMSPIIGLDEARHLGKAMLFTSLMVDIGVIFYALYSVALWISIGTNPLIALGVAAVTLIPGLNVIVNYTVKAAITLGLYMIGKIFRRMSGTK